jgi:tetratricopeptide (TPR) repeat protein
MPIKTDTELPPQQRELAAKARSAIEAKNYDYAIALLQGILKTEPAYLIGRQLLRAAAIRKSKTVTGFAKQGNNTKASMLAMKASGLAKKNPTEALMVAEEILLLDPYNSKANEISAEAAHALDLPEVEALCYETLAEGKPDDKHILHLLAHAYQKLGKLEKVQSTFERVLKIDPRDGEALSGLKNTTATQASKSGGWETAGNYRDVIKDKDMAASLEQKGKVVRSGEALDALIQENYQKHQADPQNPAHAKTIAELYTQKEDLGNAIQWYQYAYDLGGGADSALEKMISDLKVKQLDRQIAEQGGEASADPALVEELHKQKNTMKLEATKQRVAKYPNDNQFRYELGEALVNAGMYKEALPELQLGAKQPSVRLQALNLIGMCHWRRGMKDMAVKAFQSAKAEIPSMDNNKKDITYNLGKVLIELGRKAEGIEQMKEIYEIDMGYKDVNDIVEQSYSEEAAGGETVA